MIRVYRDYLKDLALVRLRFAEEYVDDSQPAHRRSTLQWVKPTQVVEVSFTEFTRDGSLRTMQRLWAYGPTSRHETSP
jgi:ATP-dependent DNA ligase